MVHYEFKPPNLAELLLLIAVGLLILFGLGLLTKTFSFPFEALQTAADAITAVFGWLALILLGIIAIELESIREHVRNIERRIR